MKHSKNIPVLPVRDTVIFPGIIMPVSVGRKKTLAAVDAAKASDNWILLVTRKTEDDKDCSPEDLYHVGTLCKIEKIKGTHESGYTVLVRGESRQTLSHLQEQNGYITADAETLIDKAGLDEGVEKALVQSLKLMAKEILNLLPSDTSRLTELLEGLDDLSHLSFLCAANLEITRHKKQELLETESVKERVLALLELMQSQKDSLTIQSDIRDRLSKKMNRVQRETILREHLRAIKEELGESKEEEQDELRTKIQKASMPKEVEKIALEELNRLEAMGPSSSESHVIRTYLDYLIAMPWIHKEANNIDIDFARKTLDEDHYGLDKVKKRIIEHLATMKLTSGAKAPILLLVGPPGVGKTSIAQSIAKSLGRKFVRASLGGVRDEAEIRGHRRTYVGAMPGRIVQAIRRAGETNPVFLLDEIDKLSTGYGGDPSAALLEVLDPEQNTTFSDHYLDVSYDLSKVFFVTTANSLDSIPAPLRDRMEVIEVNGYTTGEKLHIAKNHLLPKELKDHGITKEKLKVSDAALIRVIHNHTREAGVRELKRLLAALSRAMSEKILKSQPLEYFQLEPKDIEEILGPDRFIHEVAEKASAPGVVTGLAWTPQGGEILFIESSLMPGEGKLILTGSLGDVMKESAQIALSLVRANLPTLVPGFEYVKKDLHIHVPSGAIPKDGPSAGVALFTTIASLFMGKGIDPRIAMTGEITLRGAIMPVGGIKEKVTAAHRAGIERVILPKRNEKDLRDVPDEVKTQLKIEYVENVTQLLESLFDKAPQLIDVNQVEVTRQRQLQ